MSGFFDGLGQAVLHGINAKIDSQTTSPDQINSDKTYSTVPGGGAIPNGQTLPTGVSATNPKLWLEVGGGLLGIVILLKVLKVF